ncbi:MAG: hypothetical protein K2L11_11560 [Muribaculaceae bacterium]|nr:hypothetical protein [Muribaculaceae bacterium]
MKNVNFDTKSKKFYYTDENGFTEDFEYKPSVENIWNPIIYNDFTVDLCINPFLSREMDIIELKGSNGRCGYIFPCTLLDSSEDLSEYRHLYSYLFIAFKVLLERIPEITDEYNFSENFEDNLCVCILNVGNGTVRSDIKGIGDIMHELRPYGYSFFKDKNTIIGPKEYKPDFFLSNHRISLSFHKAALYQHPEIAEISEIVPNISNLTHRFVILYQFFEYLMQTSSSKEIEALINKYNNDLISNNDFITDIRNLESEKNRIRFIIERSNVRDPIKRDFELAVKNLFDEIDYDYKDNDGNDYPLPKLLYSFRNQMTHSYRKLHHHTAELAQTIQTFEKVVFTVLSTYN